MTVTIIIRHGSPSPPLSRPPGRYLLVNNDFDQVWSADHNFITKVSRNTRNGVAYGAPSGHAVPATARFVDDRFVNFTCDLQVWLHGLCKERVTDMSEADLKKTFASCYRDNVWITNKAGTWSRQDCINNTNIGAGFPQIQPMATGGSVLKFVGTTRIAGTDCYLIEAINPLVEYRKYHYRTHRWLFFPPSLSARWWLEFEDVNSERNRNHVDKTTRRQEWYQEPMHFYGENTEMAVFGFIPDSRSSTGWVNAVPVMRCRFLAENEPIPNPWIMRFGRTKPSPYEGF
jgi:hypothetical protein